MQTKKLSTVSNLFEFKANTCNNIEMECSICFDNMEHNQYSILEACTHHFHEGCIKEWFTKKNCPVCPICNITSEHRIELIGDCYNIVTFDKKCNNKRPKNIPTMRTPMPTPIQYNKKQNKCIIA